MSADDLIGRLAVHYQMISMDQLQLATRHQGAAPQKTLGDILVEQGLISSTQLGQLLEAQRQYMQNRAQKGGTGSTIQSKAPAPPPPPPTGPPSIRLDTGAPAAPTRPGRGRAAGPESVPLTRKEEARLEWLNRMLIHAAGSRASDVHIHANCPVKARINGSLRDLTPQNLSARDTEAIIRASVDERHQRVLDELGEVDFAYELPNVGRFRANVYNQHEGMCAVFHFVPPEIPDLLDLGLPNTLARLTNYKNGLVLITGPAGAGKTTTMAALLDLINEERTDHVLSLEDPIEYMHTSKRCLVNQREVMRHTKSFAAALKSALREDPDIICIGELRDLETISLALSAAETGHLVLGTLHTLGSVRTVNRIIGAYPPEQQGQIRVMLSESLRAVVSQKLLPSCDGGPMALAYELLIVNHAVGNLIREKRTYQLSSVLQTGRSQGMQTLDDSLMELVRAGRITRDTARLNAESPAMFK